MQYFWTSNSGFIVPFDFRFFCRTTWKYHSDGLCFLDLLFKDLKIVIWNIFKQLHFSNLHIGCTKTLASVLSNSHSKVPALFLQHFANLEWRVIIVSIKGLLWYSSCIYAHHKSIHKVIKLVRSFFSSFSSVKFKFYNKSGLC